jgi:hypothetical protein
MSTVLWANVLVDGSAVSEQSDHWALYKHTTKLDSIAKSLGLPSFLGLCDLTDARVNAGELLLPEGVESTDVLMAATGTWMDLTTARALLERLLARIIEQQPRFGLLTNDAPSVVEELQEVLAFIAAAPEGATKFNFAVVM